MKQISEEQAVNAQAKAFIQPLPDCHCEDVKALAMEIAQSSIISLANTVELYKMSELPKQSLIEYLAEALERKIKQALNSKEGKED